MDRIADFSGNLWRASFHWSQWNPCRSVGDRRRSKCAPDGRLQVDRASLAPHRHPCRMELHPGGNLRSHRIWASWGGPVSGYSYRPGLAIRRRVWCRSLGRCDRALFLRGLDLLCHCCSPGANCAANLEGKKMRLTGPGILLRLEGLAVLSAACIMYGEEGYHWGKFFLLFLVPDL